MEEWMDDRVYRDLEMESGCWRMDDGELKMESG